MHEDAREEKEFSKHNSQQRLYEMPAAGATQALRIAARRWPKYSAA